MRFGWGGCFFKGSLSPPCRLLGESKRAGWQDERVKAPAVRWPAVGGEHQSWPAAFCPALPTRLFSSPSVSLSSPHAPSPPHPVLQVVKALRSTDKKPMRQIQPVSSSPSLRPMLLSLNDEGVHLHALPTLLLKFQVRMA